MSDKTEERQQTIDFISSIVLGLATIPDMISIKARGDDKGLFIEVFAPKSELGRLIGKKGATAEALRAVLHAYATKFNLRAAFKITDIDGGHDERKDGKREEASPISLD